MIQYSFSQYPADLVWKSRRLLVAIASSTCHVAVAEQLTPWGDDSCSYTIYPFLQASNSLFMSVSRASTSIIPLQYETLFCATNSAELGQKLPTVQGKLGRVLVVETPDLSQDNSFLGPANFIYAQERYLTISFTRARVVSGTYE